MSELATISSVLGSIKAASDIAQVLKNSTTTLEEAEIKYRVADAKMEIADIRNLLLEKNEEISVLKQTLEKKSSLVFKKPCYWTIIGEEKDGPFYQRCQDTDSKLIRLQGSGKKAGDAKHAKPATTMTITFHLHQ